MNPAKTAVLMAALAGILISLGLYFGGANGAIVAFAIAAAINFSSYWMSEKIVLSMYRAQQVTRRQSPELHEIVDELAAQARIPKPRVFIVPIEVPNAFATGRNPEHSAIVVTKGLLKTLNREEIRGVLAHEISHIKHRDVLIATVAATIATAVTMLASMIRWAALFGGVGRGTSRRGGLELLALAVLAPIAALIIQLAISRSREYAADSGGAIIAGNASGLANALLKLDRINKSAGGIASPSTAHLFIVSSIQRSVFTTLFSTHPRVEDRVKRLRQIAGY